MGCSSWSMSNLIRAQIGVLLEYNGLYGNMTAKQNLLYFGQLSGLSKKEVNACIAKILSQVGFEDDFNKLVNKLSKGNRQKVALARAIMNKPKLLVLDEPTAGLDPVSQRDVRKMLVQLADEKQTALLVTSHNMAEVAFIANKMLILKAGENIAFGTPDEFIKKWGYVVEVNLNNNDRLSDAVCLLKERAKWNKIEKISATKIQVYTKDTGNIDETLKSILVNEGFADITCTKRYPTLEESYYYLMEE
ncbi:Vitamin B12 import ATP-binding protein BtuD [subsurface metagenome]